MPLARGLRVTCSNALRTNLPLGTLACCASLSRRASSFSGMLHLSVVMVVILAHFAANAMLRLPDDGGKSVTGQSETAI